MKRIRHISALEILIVWNKKNYYTVDLDYGIVVSGPESLAGDGYPPAPSTKPQAVYTEQSMSELKFGPSGSPLTVTSMHSGN